MADPITWGGLLVPYLPAYIVAAAEEHGNLVTGTVNPIFVFCDVAAQSIGAVKGGQEQARPTYRVQLSYLPQALSELLIELYSVEQEIILINLGRHTHPMAGKTYSVQQAAFRMPLPPGSRLGQHLQLLKDEALIADNRRIIGWTAFMVHLTRQNVAWPQLAVKLAGIGSDGNHSDVGLQHSDLHDKVRDEYRQFYWQTLSQENEHDRNFS